MYTNADTPLETLTQLSDTLGQSELEDIVSAAKEKLSQPHAPTLALAEAEGGGARLKMAIEAVLGAKAPEACLRALAGGNALFLLEYGVEEGWAGAHAYRAPIPKLKNLRLALSSGALSGEGWPRFMDEIDVLCLRVHAAMAMTGPERAWLKNRAALLHGKERFALWLDGMETLNRDEERSQVWALSRSALSAAGLNDANVLTDADALQRRLRVMMADGALAARRERQLLKNAVRAFGEALSRMQAARLMDAGRFESARAQLEKQKDGAQAAALMACDEVKQAYLAYLTDARTCVDAHCESACEAVREALAGAADANAALARADALLEEKWRACQNALAARFEAVAASAEDILLRRMQRDAGALFDRLDSDAVAVVNLAVSLQSGNGGLPGARRAGILTKDGRGLLMMSFPVIAVSPVCGAAFLLGAAAYNALSRRDEKRDALETQIQNACAYTRRAFENARRRVEMNIEESMRRCLESVRAAYARWVDLLVEDVNALSRKGAAVRRAQGALDEAIHLRLPELSRRLDGDTV